MAWKVKLILCTMTVCIFSVYANEVSPNMCCPPGQLVLRRKTDPQYCWDPVSNETSFINLQCQGVNSSTIWIGIGRLRDIVVRDNNLLLLLPNYEVEYLNGSFCVGNLSNIKNRNWTRRAAVVCPHNDVRIIEDEVYGVCMAVSTFLLLLTVVIYLALPELWDLQGKSIINFCLSLGIGLGVLAIMKLMAYEDMKLCAVRGFFAYFFIVASFFWTNAISIQILRGLSRPTVCDYGWREFIYYAAYAWGCSTVLTIAMAIINFMPGEHLKPGIGLNHCWFFSSKQQWQYMYSVMSILTLVNIAIFVYTSCVLCRGVFSSSHIKALRFKFFMTVKMFIVMGVPWIFEMAGSLTSSHIVWEIIDILNSLQGVYVFLVLVVFRMRVVKLIHRAGWCFCLSSAVEQCLSREDDEEQVVQHTVALSMDEQNNKH